MSLWNFVRFEDINQTVVLSGERKLRPRSRQLMRLAQVTVVMGPLIANALAPSLYAEPISVNIPIFTVQVGSRYNAEQPKNPPFRERFARHFDPDYLAGRRLSLQRIDSGGNSDSDHDLIARVVFANQIGDDGLGGVLLNLADIRKGLKGKGLSQRCQLTK